MSVWTNEDLEFLKNNYNKLTKKEIADILNKTSCAVQLKANRLGLKKDEKYHYNKSFFKEIVNPSQAYWLGFIYADGYITANKTKTKYSIGIELNVNDYEHLKKFNNSIEGNVPVTSRIRNGHIIVNHAVGEFRICSIRLYCTQMAKDLESHGCCLNKSLIKTKPVGIPENLMRDFIRGYFDGNGTICTSYNKQVDKSYLKVQIETGSKEFSNWISIYLKENGFENHIVDDKNAYKIQIYSKSNQKFLDYIYKDSEIYLNRKYEKYLCAVYGESNTLAINN